MTSLLKTNAILQCMTDNFLSEFPDEEVPSEIQTINIEKENTYLVHNYCVEDLSKVPRDVKHVYFSALFNNYIYEDLLKLPNTVETLYLGHDGVIFCRNGIDTIRELLNHFQMLKKFHYCSYYTYYILNDDIDRPKVDRDNHPIYDLKNLVKELNRDIELIEII
jgi:hypothetical protein